MTIPHLRRYDIDNDFELTVTRVEVRWAVVVGMNPYDDSEEA